MALAQLPVITILSGGTNSTIIQGISIDDADGIWLQNTAYDAAVTYKLQVSFDRKATASSVWKDYVDTLGSTVRPPGSALASMLPFLTVSFRIVASGNVANDVTWNAAKLWSGI